MISVLVVAAREADLGELAGRHPSVEILTAHGVEDALDISAWKPSASSTRAASAAKRPARNRVS
jgi:hypothetical protein